MAKHETFPQGAGTGTYFRRLPNGSWVMLNSGNQWVGVQDPTTWVSAQNEQKLKPCPTEAEHLCCYPNCNCATQREPDHALSARHETIVSLSQEIEKLRKDYDECDKETLVLKLRIRHLEMLGTQSELGLLGRVLNRLAKYEPDFKLDDLFKSKK